MSQDTRTDGSPESACKITNLRHKERWICAAARNIAMCLLDHLTGSHLLLRVSSLVLPWSALGDPRWQCRFIVDPLEVSPVIDGSSLCYIFIRRCQAMIVGRCATVDGVKGNVSPCRLITPSCHVAEERYKPNLSILSLKMAPDQHHAGKTNKGICAKK